MKLSHYLSSPESHLLSEAVIVPTVKGFLDKLDDIKNEELTFIQPFYNNTQDLIKIINTVFNQDDVYVIVSDKGKLSASTSTNGKIKIFVTENLYNVFKDDRKYKKFREWIKTILSHELVHREQGKRINWNKFTVQSINQKSRSEYLEDEQEIMAYANTVVNQLYRKLGTTKKVFNFLRIPENNVSKVFDMYVEEFGKNSKVVKRLYKYVYEYVIKQE